MNQIIEGLAQIIKALVELVIWVVGGLFSLVEWDTESCDQKTEKPRRRRGPVTAHWNRAEERRRERMLRPARLPRSRGNNTQGALTPSVPEPPVAPIPSMESSQW